MPHLTVMTYNIRTGIGMDGVRDLERIAGVIRESTAVVVGLQEVDKGTTRSDGVDQTKVLAELLGMDYVFGPAYPHRGGFFGPAVLTALPILEKRLIPLPHKESNESRMAVWVRVQWEGREIIVINTHLEHADPEDRARQGAALAEIVAEAVQSAPTMLMGDLNARPSEVAVFTGIKAYLRDAYELAMERARGNGKADDLGEGFTFDSVRPYKRIDYVCLVPRLDLADEEGAFRIVPNQAADDMPLVVRVRTVQ